MWGWKRKVKQAEKRAENGEGNHEELAKLWDKLTRAMLLLADMDIEVCRMSYLEVWPSAGKGKLCYSKKRHLKRFSVTPHRVAQQYGDDISDVRAEQIYGKRKLRKLQQPAAAWGR